MIKRYLLYPEYWILLISLLLLRLPVALGERQNPAVRLIFILPILGISMYLLFVSAHKKRILFDKKIFLLFSAFATLLSIGFIRTGLNGIFLVTTILGNWLVWITIAVFSFALFISAPNEKVRYQYRRGFILAFGIYILLNFALYLLGFEPPEKHVQTNSTGILLGTLGVHIQRVVFPTSTGFNTFGSIVGTFTVASVAILTHRASARLDKMIAILGGLCSFVIIFLTDSRAALALSTLLILTIFLLPQKLYPKLKYIALVAPLLPVILILVINLLPAELASGLSRSGSDFSNMSNRMTIWQIVLDEFKHFTPLHLFGFGYRGQVSAGLSEQYAYFFSSYAEGGQASSHNFFLQSIIETGYIGTLVFIFLLYVMISKLARFSIRNKYDHTPRTTLFILIYCILAGTTESVLSPDFQELFVLFLMICAASSTLYPSRSNDYLSQKPSYYVSEKDIVSPN